jgi:hypothetical protein
MDRILLRIRPFLARRAEAQGFSRGSGDGRAAGAGRLCAPAGTVVSEPLAEGRAMVRPCASEDNKMIALKFARTVRCAVPRARAWLSPLPHA